MFHIRGLNIFFLLLLSHGLWAQAPYNFYNLSLDKGLSDPRVNDIVQDKYGFMWFATPNGLNRFDGYTIKTFFADSAQKELPANNILSLFSDSKGQLWIGTTAGLVLFDFSKQRFTHIDTSGGSAAAEVSRMAVYDFAEDANGNTYVGGQNGLFRLLAKEKKWESLGSRYHVDSRLKQVRRLKFFNKDLLFATTYGNLPFFKIDITRNQVDSIYYRTVYDDTCCLNMFGMEKLNDEELLTGFLSIGIARLNVNTKKYSIVPGVLGRNDSILYNTAYDILKDHNGRIWIGSYYFGLTEYLPRENKVLSFEKQPGNPRVFDGSSILCLYEDQRQNIWIGTGTRGVYHFNPGRLTTTFHASDDEGGALQRGAVLSLSAVDSNHLLIGTERGPSLYDYRTQKYTNYKGVSTTGIHTAVEQVQCGFADSNGIIWMGSSRLGLMRYDTKNKQFRNFSRVSLPYPLQDDGITEILPLPGEKLLLIGFGRPGIFDTRLSRYYSFRNDSGNAFLKLNGISTVAHDSHKQNIWAATSAGKLYEYDPLPGSLQDRTQLLSAIRQPFNIYKIAWKNDTLYLATSKGIMLVAPGQQARLFALRQPDNSLNEIKGILPEGDHIWFSNNHLVGKLFPATGKIVLLGQKDGFADVQLFSRSLAFSPRGTIIIGSNKGYYEIFGERINENETAIPAAPRLTGFRVYESSLVTDEVISDVKKIDLDYNQNFFSFDFSSFDYAVSDDIEYAYRLEGFDKDWQYTGTRRSGSYTNVPGGDYVLRIKARIHSGEWNEKGQQLMIHIDKPFWQTWWFRLLLILIVAVIGWSVYRNRIGRIRKEARLRSDYEIKLNELENSALRTQMNPHFIFNSLNTINSFINSNDRVQANQYISKFSKLVRLILDHSREKKIILKDELEVAELYMQLEQIRFENKFHYSIDIKDVDAVSTEVPPLIIQPFVENAILHGLLPGEKGGILKIEISKNGELLQCSIQDNGIGRQAAKKIRERSGYARKSHGMEITLKRIELFNREHGVKDPVVVEDMTAANGAPAGTRVLILLAYLETF